MTKIDNKYKIILRALIIGLILVSSNNALILNINTNVKRLLTDFMQNLSYRRRLDNDFFLELMMIQRILDEGRLHLELEDSRELKMLDEYNNKMRKFLESIDKDKEN